VELPLFGAVDSGKQPPGGPMRAQATAMARMPLRPEPSVVRAAPPEERITPPPRNDSNDRMAVAGRAA